VTVHCGILFYISICLFLENTWLNQVVPQFVVHFFCLGATMVPVSWTEMQCPVTGQIEQRKVAKAAS